MDLDYDPIYCVEQIQIPPNLPDLLKRFAKEAIRSQPSSLEEFAANYFNNLLKTKQNVKETPPTLLQLQGIWDGIKDNDFMKLDDVAVLCASHGISDTIFQKVFQLIEFPASLVDPKEVIVLLITTTAKTFVSVMEHAFNVFGHQNGNRLSLALFFKILFLQAKRDPEVSPEIVSGLTQDLDGKESISYVEFQANPRMKQHFASKHR